MPILDDESLDLALENPVEGQTLNLSAAREEMARLRYLVILTARWESSDNLDAKGRARLRTDLAQLRFQYSQKIDEIAMTVGVQQAMEAQAHVEHSVSVPHGARIPGAERHEDSYEL